MVIDDLDVPGFAVSPNEANAPLLVDPNAVLSLPVAAQGFQAIAGRRPQIVNLLCRIDCDKLRARSPLDLPWQITNGVAGEDRRGAFVGEALDHDEAYHNSVRSINRFVPRDGTLEYQLSLLYCWSYLCHNLCGWQWPGSPLQPAENFGKPPRRKPPRTARNILIVSGFSGGFQVASPWLPESTRESSARLRRPQ